MNAIQKASIGLVSLVMLGAGPVYSVEKANEKAVQRGSAPAAGTASPAKSSPAPKQYSPPARVYTPVRRESEVRHPGPRASNPPRLDQDRAVPRGSPPQSNPAPAPSQSSPGNDSYQGSSTATPRGEAERRHPRPDGVPSTRPVVIDRNNQYFYPQWYGGYPYHRGPWWWDNSMYYWNAWDRHTVIYLQGETKQERNIKKEDYNIYRLSTFTPVALEDLIFDKNVLGYCSGQLDELRDIRNDYMREFWDAATKYESEPDKMRDKQMKQMKYYTKELEDFLKDEQPKCR